jgi:hypothetical protein
MISITDLFPASIRMSVLSTLPISALTPTKEDPPIDGLTMSDNDQMTATNTEIEEAGKTGDSAENGDGDFLRQTSGRGSRLRRFFNWGRK